MVLGLVPDAQHVDDLDVLLRQQRLLGVGVVVGGLFGGAVWGLSAWTFAPWGVFFAGFGPWALVALAGLLHVAVGAPLAQARAARRMLRRAPDAA